MILRCGNIKVNLENKCKCEITYTYHENENTKLNSMLVIMWLTSELKIQEYLRDRSKVQRLVELFDPVVRAVDGFAGERVSMRVRRMKTIELLLSLFILFLLYSVELLPCYMKYLNKLCHLLIYMNLKLKISLSSEQVDLECSSGRHTIGIFSHKRLSVYVIIIFLLFLFSGDICFFTLVKLLKGRLL